MTTEHRRLKVFAVAQEMSSIMSAYIGELEIESDYDREAEAIVILNVVAAAYGFDRYIRRPEC